MGTSKKPLQKLQFPQILALSNDDDFILNLNNNLKGEMDPGKWDELERYFVAITNRLNGVEPEKNGHFGGRGLYSYPQKRSLDRVEPAFCKAVQKNVVYEVSKKLFIIALAQNSRVFKGWEWQFKIYGCGSGPNKYIPEIYLGPRNKHLYTFRTQGGMVYNVEIMVFYLLHFARLPVANAKYFSCQDGSRFRLNPAKQTYDKVFSTYLNMLLPDMLKNKKRKERSRKGPQFIQVFGDLWFSPSFSDSPVIDRVGLLPLMKALVRRVVITQAFHQWEWENLGLPGKELSSRTCLSFESQSLQRPLFQFMFQAFTQWPLDTAQDIVTVVDMWIQFLTPWNIEQKRQLSMTSEEFHKVWGQWVAENFPFYSTLLKEFLRFAVNLDFRSLWVRKMLIKVLKTFDDCLVRLIKENELTIIEGTHGYSNFQSEFWTSAVKRMLEHCYLPDTGDRGLAFLNPHPFDAHTSHSLEYLGKRAKKSTRILNLESSSPCLKIVNTLINNILESEAQPNQPATMSFSASLWTRIFRSSSPAESKYEHETCRKELARLFKVELETRPLRHHQYSWRTFCEVDKVGHLTEVGRQQLISGEKIIDPQNWEFLRLMDVWEKPAMEFEIVFLLDFMRKLESALLKILGAEEQTKKNYFLYGIGRRFASTSAVFWFSICLCCVCYWNRALFIFCITIFSLVGVLTILPNRIIRIRS